MPFQTGRDGQRASGPGSFRSNRRQTGSGRQLSRKPLPAACEWAIPRRTYSSSNLDLSPVRTAGNSTSRACRLLSVCEDRESQIGVSQLCPRRVRPRCIADRPLQRREKIFSASRALYKDQPTWVVRLRRRSAGPARGDSRTMQPERAISGGRPRLLVFQAWAAARGVPPAKATQCLARTESAINQLVQMTSEATRQFPEFKGTPTFIIERPAVPDPGRFGGVDDWRPGSKRRLAGKGRVRGRGRGCGSGG